MNEIVGSHIIRIQELGSTNNYAAAQLLTKSLPEGVVFLADSQVDGRGQGDNKWESEPNKNLTFSILLYPNFLKIDRQFLISKTISLGIADYLKEQTSLVSIKWPNDIYIGKRKVAGILIENSIRNNIFSSCIVGIGLNINQIKFTGDAPNPVSLSLITGKIYNLDETLVELCLKINARYLQLRSLKSSQIDDDYAQMLYQLDDWSIYKDENDEFEGRIIGVDQSARLMIETRSGKINKYNFKEVVFK